MYLFSIVPLFFNDPYHNCTSEIQMIIIDTTMPMHDNASNAYLYIVLTPF